MTASEVNMSMNTNNGSNDSYSINNPDNRMSDIKREVDHSVETNLEDDHDNKQEVGSSELQSHGSEESSSASLCMEQNENSDDTPNKCSTNEAVERKRRKGRPMLRNKSLVRPYHCELCPMAFNRPQHLKGHMSTHLDEESYKCDICGKCYNRKSNLKAHKFVHSGEKPFPCESCGKGFAQKVALEYHMRIHTGERPYPCDKCNKAFRSAPHLEVHRRTHTEIRPYACDLCTKQFKMPAHLNAHRRIHTGEKPYVCEICNKAIGHLQSYRNHIQLHKSKKGYSCTICSKTFISTRDLTSHSQDHISSEVGKLYKCERCFVSFPTELDLKLHTELHSNKKSDLYTCHCGEVFASEQEIEDHEKVHLGETPYTGDICNQSFTHSALLTEHMEEDEDKDKKPIICEFCNKVFSTQNELNNHLCITQCTTQSDESD